MSNFSIWAKFYIEPKSVDRKKLFTQNLAPITSFLSQNSGFLQKKQKQGLLLESRSYLSVFAPNIF